MQQQQSTTPGWIDGFGRRIDYLRISVTDRCDLRCSYCTPAGFSDYEEPANWLDFDEIGRIVGVLAARGLQRVRLTGGEPLLRRGLDVLAGRLRRIPGIADLSLSTNGTQLQKRAAALRAAGVDRLNVSLDTLDRARFASLVKRDVLDEVLGGLSLAAGLGFKSIKINMVWLPETDAAELEAMIEFCRARGFVLRLIETMPLGAAGHAAGHASLQPTIAALRERFGLLDGVVPGGGPARYLSSPDGKFSLGFITPLSQHFCATCNRVRLTVDGMLHLCLGQEDRLDLRALLRAGASDADLDAAIRTALLRKPERHEFREAPMKLWRPMLKTGG